MPRYKLAERCFAEIHRTGLDRNAYELIIVNNGGVHHNLIQTVGADLIIANSKNIGQAAALNLGASVARSENLVFLDDDLSFE